MKNNLKALLVVDIQNDFCPGGALAVQDGDKIVPIVNNIMNKYEIVVGTQDWHPRSQVSFASNHKGKSAYDQINVDGVMQTLWPDHCVAGTRGADFHKDLNTERFNIILRKGSNPNIDSYSAFLENDKKTETGLHGYLKVLDVSEIYICGLATDYCVFYTAMDCVKYGFRTLVIFDACKGINVPEGSINDSIKIMKDNKIQIKNTDEL